MKNLYYSLLLLVPLISCSEQEPILEMAEGLSTIELVGAWQIDMVITDFYRDYQQGAGAPLQSTVELKDNQDEVSQVIGSITFEDGNTGFFTIKSSRSLADFDEKEFTWEIANDELIKVYFPKFWPMEWNMINVKTENLTFDWLFDDTNTDFLREISMSKL